MRLWIKENWFKLLGVFLLLATLRDNPYYFYFVLRWVVSIILGVVAWQTWKPRKIGSMILSVLFVLFNPITPFYSSKTIWAGLDIVAALLLFVSIFAVGQQKWAAALNRVLIGIYAVSCFIYVPMLSGSMCRREIPFCIFDNFNTGWDNIYTMADSCVRAYAYVMFYSVIPGLFYLIYLKGKSDGRKGIQ